MRSEERTRQANVTGIGFWLLLGLSVFAWAPATYPGYWAGLEGFTPIFHVTDGAALAEVGVTPDVWRGAGSAAYLLARSLTALGLSASAGVRLTFLLALLLGGLGSYAWLRPRLGDRGAALAGLVYLLFPPFLAVVYVRGSLADALVIGLLPLALAGVAAYPSSRAPSAAGVTVISLLWMWRAQAGLALWATLLVLAYAWLVEGDRWSVLIALVSGGAGLISLLPLWPIQAPAPVVFGEHLVYLFQLFDTAWATAPSIPGWQDGYPFQLGFAGVGLGLAALALAASRGAGGLGRLLAFSLGGVILLVGLTLTISGPLWAISGAGRLLTYPWQLLPLTAPLFAALAGSLPRLDASLARPPLWAALLGLTVLAAFPSLQPNFTQVTPPAQPVAVFGDGAGANAFLLLGADLRMEGEQAVLDLTWQSLRTPDFDYNLFFQAIVPAGEGGEEGGEQVAAQLDVQPVAGTRPATTWQPGEILTDTLGLSLPPLTAAQAEGLRFYLGYYDWRTGERLTGQVGLLRDDKVVLRGE